MNLVLEKYKKYEGKFREEEINRGASPDARSSVFGHTYSEQRIFKPTAKKEIEIISYRRQFIMKKGIGVEQIDKILDHRYTAGNWFRLDRGGRSLPGPTDWLKLKEILELDNKYDEKMTKTDYALQAVMDYPLGKNPGDMWSIKTDKISETHFAIFPEDLVKRIIKSSCPPDGVVLDPFAGSGTTGKVTMELGRKSIMIEINPEHVKIMEKRFKAGIRKLSNKW